MDAYMRRACYGIGCSRWGGPLAPKVAALVVALSALGATSLALAQNYPARPVRLVVPFAASGPADAIARLVAPPLSAAWDQQMVVDNRGGASGRTRAVNRVPACGM